MPKVEEPNDKMREQIEEILELEESRSSKSPGPIRIAKPTPKRKVRSGGVPVWYPTPEKLIVAGIVIMLIAALTRRAVLPLVLVGFLVSGIGYYMLIMRKRREKYGRSPGGSGPAPSQYWRGKRIDSKAPVKKAKGKILEFPDPKKDKDLRD